MSATVFSLALFALNTQVLAQSFEVDLTVSSGASTIELSFGLHPTASNGVDADLGEKGLPPLPPAFEARFIDEHIAPDFGGAADQGMYVDFRSCAALPCEVVHELLINFGDASDATIHWAMPEDVRGEIRDRATGGQEIDEPMSGVGALVISKSALAEFILTMTYGSEEPPPNEDPVAADDEASTLEDAPVDVAVLNNDSDPDGGSLEISSVDAPSNGTATDNGDGTIRFTPDADFNGSDQFVYTISDGDGGSDEAIVAVTVTPVQDEPFFTSVPPTNATEGAAYTYAITAADVDGDALTLIAETIPDWLSLTDDGGGDGTLSGTPTSADGGVHEVVLIVDDGHGNHAEQRFAIAVQSVSNAQPEAADDEASTLEDEPVDIPILSNDSDPDGGTLEISSVDAPSNGTATDNGDDSIRYTPDADFNGSDSFVYTISDGNGGAGEATVEVLVAAVNDPPHFTSEINAVDAVESIATTVQLEAADPDVDTNGDRLVFTIAEGPDGVTIDPETGLLTIETLAGTYVIRVAVNDADGETAELSLAVDVARGVSTESTDQPERSLTFENYPNPFHSSTTISFDLPEASHVLVAIYNVLGHEVEVLVNAHFPAGAHDVAWHADDRSSGIYVCRITAGREVRALTMVLMR